MADEMVINPSTGNLDRIGSGGAESDPLSVHLDQTTPQVTIGTFVFPDGVTTGATIESKAGPDLTSFSSNVHFVARGYTGVSDDYLVEMAFDAENLRGILQAYNEDAASGIPLHIQPYGGNFLISDLEGPLVSTAGLVSGMDYGLAGQVLRVNATADGMEWVTPFTWDYDYGDLINAPSIPDNLTDFVSQTAWRLFYSNTDGDVTELAFGDSGKVLQSNGAAAAPTWETASGSGLTHPQVLARTLGA